MCGIVGIVGNSDFAQRLFGGLKRLEYRGYDSAGICTIEEGQLSGVFRDDVKPIIAAKILYGGLDEMVTNWILSKKKYPLAPMAREVLKTFFDGVNTR